MFPWKLHSFPIYYNWKVYISFLSPLMSWYHIIFLQEPKNLPKFYTAASGLPWPPNIKDIISYHLPSPSKPRHSLFHHHLIYFIPLYLLYSSHSLSLFWWSFFASPTGTWGSPDSNSCLFRGLPCPLNLEWWPGNSMYLIITFLGSQSFSPDQNRLAF